MSESMNERALLLRERDGRNVGSALPTHPKLGGHFGERDMARTRDVNRHTSQRPKLLLRDGHHILLRRRSLT
jgi:hypothetical protein